MDFSVIIPAKNEAANIGRLVASLLAMKRPVGSYEILVIDNGSSDETPVIAAALGAQVHVKPDLTISALRNFGASLARGEVLAFMDADCTVAPDWLDEAARYLPRRDIVCFGSPPEVPPDATWVQRTWFQVRRKRPPVGETAWLESMNMFVRRESFALAGGFDESLATCEDYDLSLRLARLGLLWADDRIVAFHYGEARDLGHFYRKERWRGIGNLKGVLHHGVRLAELPSLLFPVAHCLVALALPLTLVPVLVGWVAPIVFCLVAGLFAAWQLLILLLAYLKFGAGLSARFLRLFVLLNVYYFARGVALSR